MDYLPIKAGCSTKIGILVLSAFTRSGQALMEGALPTLAVAMVSAHAHANFSGSGESDTCAQERKGC